MSPFRMINPFSNPRVNEMPVKKEKCNDEISPPKERVLNRETSKRNNVPHVIIDVAQLNHRVFEFQKEILNKKVGCIPGVIDSNKSISNHNSKRLSQKIHRISAFTTPTDKSDRSSSHASSDHIPIFSGSPTIRPYHLKGMEKLTSPTKDILILK